MLPPIDDAVLQSNPKFAALHANLANHILNANGSTKNHPSQKERDSTQPHLNSAQIRSAKSQFLLTSLGNIDLFSPSTIKPSKTQHKPAPPPLPSEVVELILLLTSRLSANHIPPSHIKLLESTPQWQLLPKHIPYLASLLSVHLQTQASALAKILTPNINPSFLHRSIPKVYSGVAEIQTRIATKRFTLHKQRSALTTQTIHLLQAYQTAIALTIQILETSKHGSLSLERHSLNKISYLTLEIQKVEQEARGKGAKGVKMVYTSEVIRALGQYKENLRDARERLSDRKRGTERVLWEYGVGRSADDGGRGKARVMREIARVYGELAKELRDVERDVERLRAK